MVFIWQVFRQALLVLLQNLIFLTVAIACSLVMFFLLIIAEKSGFRTTELYIKIILISFSGIWFLAILAIIFIRLTRRYGGADYGLRLCISIFRRRILPLAIIVSLQIVMMFFGVAFLMLTALVGFGDGYPVVRLVSALIISGTLFWSVYCLIPVISGTASHPDHDGTDGVVGGLRLVRGRRLAMFVTSIIVAVMIIASRQVLGMFEFFGFSLAFAVLGVLWVGAVGMSCFVVLVREHRAAEQARVIAAFD